MAMGKEIHFRLSDSEHEGLKKFAREIENKTGKYITASELIRLAVKKMLAEFKP
jgi:Arc/MetJ-type ribon-helix-helix transcriptional regulator